MSRDPVTKRGTQTLHISRARTFTGQNSSVVHPFIHPLAADGSSHELKSGYSDPLKKEPVKHGHVMCDICPSTGRHPAAFRVSGGACRVAEYPAELRRDDHMAGKVQ